MDAQTSKHNKNKKKVLKTEINNGDAEVYVLSPELLQKLGINLSAVNPDLQPSLDTMPKKDIFDYEQSKKAQSGFPKNIDKTISETANLLKESMLITGSPTLTPTLSKILEGEIEISNESEEINNASNVAFNGSDKSEVNGKTYECAITTLVNADLKAKYINICDDKICTINPTDDANKLLLANKCLEDDKKDENKNYYDDGNKRILKDKIRKMVKNKYAVSTETNAKAHDVSKSQVCNESKMECADTSNDIINIPNNNSFKISCPSTTSKISIISEEIVDCSKLRELKKIHSQNVADLTPVTIKTVITTKKTDNLKNKQKDTLIEVETRYSDESNKINNIVHSPNLTSLAKNDMNGENSDEYRSMDNESYSCEPNLKKQDNLSKPCIFSEVKMNLSHNRLNTQQVKDYQSIPDGECKVNDILEDADFLKLSNKGLLSPVNMNEFNNNELNEEINLTCGDIKEPKVVHSKHIIPNDEQDMITVKSKLSIQGVEKPGGEQNGKLNENMSKIIKTYPKCKRLTTPIVYNLATKNTNGILCNSREGGIEEIDTVISHEGHDCQEFCICEDFGLLHFYHDDSEYEHIHFWKRNIAGVEPELIFSIYDDELCNRYSPDFSIICTNIGDEENSNTMVKFCWNEYISNGYIGTNNEVNDCASYTQQISNTDNNDHMNDTCKHNSTLFDNEHTASSVEIHSTNDENISMRNISEELSKHTKSSSDKRLGPNDGNISSQKKMEEQLRANTELVEVLVIRDDSESIQKGSDEQTEHNESSPKKILDTGDEEILSNQGEFKKKSGILNNLGSTMIENNREILKIESKTSLASITVYDSTIKESIKELPIVNTTKENSSDRLLKEIDKDVEIPVPKRKRGRPRKQVPIISEDCKGDEIVKSKETNDTPNISFEESSPRIMRYSKRISSSSSYNNDHSESVRCIDSLADNQNQTVEETSTAGRKRKRRTNVSVAYSEDINDQSVRPSRSCSRRSNRNQSSNSMSTCNDDSVVQDVPNNDESDVKCGVCNEVIKSSNWIDHIAKEHDYLAWKEGSQPINVNDEIEVKNHMINILKETDALVCCTCGIKRKYILSYIKHRKTCGSNDNNVSLESHNTTETDQQESRILETCNMNISLNDSNGSVRCGVCSEDVEGSNWMQHIQREHYYLAWADGNTPLNLNDAEEVKMYLMALCRRIGGLKCHKCGLVRKYANVYLQHVRTCESEGLTAFYVLLDGDKVRCGVCSEEVAMSEWKNHAMSNHYNIAWKVGDPRINGNDVSLASHNTTETDLQESRILETCNMNLSSKDSNESVRCGVCSEEVKGSNWIRHIQREHYYLAWTDGNTPLNLNDADEVKMYLMAVCRKIGGLMCHKCGLVRKYANVYLQHVRTCESEGLAAFDSETPVLLDGDKVRCAVCSEEVAMSEWKNHAMSNHYNIAWKVGEPPIDVKNFYVVESYLKEYKRKYDQLVCKTCNDNKSSCYGFYAHLLQCGKTEEELEEYKVLCEVCNKKMLCIYKTQHMKAHREKEYSIERKLMLAEAREQAEKEDNATETPGRRKAAEKARTVIAKYKDECQGAGQKAESEFNTGYSSDSDVSVKLEQYTDEESEDSDEHSDASADERNERADADRRRRRRAAETNAPTITRIPFPVKNVKSYINESYEDFCNNNLTREKLFPEWSDCEYEKLSEEQIDKYMPPLQESCKVKVAHGGWSTYKRFQTEIKNDCITLFAGASVQCVSWAAAGVREAGRHTEDSTRNMLALAAHSGADCPRYNCHEAPAHSGLLQIWDFGQLNSSTPKLALGLAHDYGTVWAMDWCPSGARDFLDEENENHSKRRLGLLSIACSNGSAYIFSVPYPSEITVSDDIFYKLKPVAELRLWSSVEDERKLQATSLCWSLQKGHNIIVVGYSNGTIAYYDLGNDSPLLTTKENGVTIIYPFHDERSHNSCVTGVDVFASGGGGGAVCSASASGARLSSGAGVGAGAGWGRGGALLSPLACAGAFFLPHWPSAVLTAVNSKVSQTVNELEWQVVGGGGCAGGGRRVGGVRARAPCRRCAALAAADEPLLTVMRAHPAHHRRHHQHQHQHQHEQNNAHPTREPDIIKRVTAILQMTSLAKKRKQTNDELAMKLEPLTYDEAVQKYGIELQLVSKKNKVFQQKALSTPMVHYPERFPLAEITSMSFCPTAAHHNKLAVGTHAGILFLINA